MQSTDGLHVTFLEDGGQSPEQVAEELIAFLGSANTSLDIAIYDSALSGDLASSVGQALRDAAGRGVQVRIAYYAGPHPTPSLIAPPAGSSLAFLEPLGISVRPIQGFQALMHDKYIIRDAQAQAAAVWTGSTNWTADAWGREENIILQISSADLARRYLADFEELWESGHIENTGTDAGGPSTVLHGGELVPVRVWFSPGQGVDMAHAVAHAISLAERQIVIASPVLTDGAILGALADMLHAGRVPVRGVYDRTQMEEALRQWAEVPQARWKVAAFNGIAQAAHFSSKRSTPYAPGSVHDYMHVKLVVVDDAVFTGSYNFSHSGEENAENLLRIDDAGLATACVGYIDRLIGRYALGAN